MSRFEEELELRVRLKELNRAYTPAEGERELGYELYNQLWLANNRILTMIQAGDFEALEYFIKAYDIFGEDK